MVDFQLDRIAIRRLGFLLDYLAGLGLAAGPLHRRPHTSFVAFEHLALNLKALLCYFRDRLHPRFAGFGDATLLIHRAGVEQRAIEQILGHASHTMTARYSRDGLPLTRLAGAMAARDWE